MTVLFENDKIKNLREFSEYFVLLALCFIANLQNILNSWSPYGTLLLTRKQPSISVVRKNRNLYLQNKLITIF